MRLCVFPVAWLGAYRVYGCDHSNHVLATYVSVLQNADHVEIKLLTTVNQIHSFTCSCLKGDVDGVPLYLSVYTSFKNKCSFEHDFRVFILFFIWRTSPYFVFNLVFAYILQTFLFPLIPIFSQMQAVTEKLNDTNGLRSSSSPGYDSYPPSRTPSTRSMRLSRSGSAGSEFIHQGNRSVSRFWNYYPWTISFRKPSPKTTTPTRKRLSQFNLPLNCLRVTRVVF